MSYCRWSSDGYNCDLYVYESDAGWMTHVAGRRRVSDQPRPVPPVATDLPGVDIDNWLAWWKAIHAWCDAAKLEPIGLVCDGQTFVDDTPGDCADRLVWLKGLGYIVPQYAIDELRQEQAAAPND